MLLSHPEPRARAYSHPARTQTAVSKIPPMPASAEASLLLAVATQRRGIPTAAVRCARLSTFCARRRRSSFYAAPSPRGRRGEQHWAAILERRKDRRCSPPNGDDRRPAAVHAATAARRAPVDGGDKQDEHVTVGDDNYR